MRTNYLYLIILLLTSAIISTSFAQDNTQLGLPEGAIARLGKGGINIMRFSPDGTHLAVGTDVCIWIYDVADGTETALYSGYSGQVNALAFSPDGNILASAGANNPVIQFWDVETRSKLNTIQLREFVFSIPALAFYGRTLVSLNSSRQITYWHAETGRKLSEEDGLEQFDAAVFSENGTMLAIFDRKRKIHLWDTTASSQLGTLMGHGGGPDSMVLSMAFSPNENILASACEDKTVKLWDTKNYTLHATLRGHKTWVTAVAYSNDGKTLVSGDADKTIKIWDVKTQQERVTIKGHKSTINTLTFAPEGHSRYSSCLVSGSADGTIKFWNPDNGEEPTTFTTGHIESVKAVAFSENDKTLVSAAYNGNVEMWDLSTMEKQTTFTKGQTDIADILMFSSDATYYVRQSWLGYIAFSTFGLGYHSGTARSFNNFKLLNITTGKEIPGPWEATTDALTTAAFSPTDDVLAVINDNELLGWDINSGNELFQFNIDWNPDGNLVFSSDGKRIAKIDAADNPHVWNLEKMDEPPKVSDKHGDILAFSPNGKILAIGGKDAAIYFWEYDKDGENETTIERQGFYGFEKTMTFSPDGSILLDLGHVHWNIHIELWDVKMGRKMGRLIGHTEFITSLVFSHDGKILSSTSEDGTILLWDWDKIVSKMKGENK